MHLLSLRCSSSKHEQKTRQKWYAASYPSYSVRNYQGKKLRTIIAFLIQNNNKNTCKLAMFSIEAFDFSKRLSSCFHWTPNNSSFLIEIEAQEKNDYYHKLPKHRPETVWYLYTLGSFQFNMGNIAFDKKFESNLQFSIKWSVRIVFKYLWPLTPWDKTMIEVNSCNNIK